jgi:hypothetical protein
LIDGAQTEALLVLAQLGRAGLAGAVHAAAQVVEVVVHGADGAVVDQVHVEPGADAAAGGGDVHRHHHGRAGAGWRRWGVAEARPGHLQSSVAGRVGLHHPVHRAQGGEHGEGPRRCRRARHQHPLGRPAGLFETGQQGRVGQADGAQQHRDALAGGPGTLAGG